MKKSDIYPLPEYFDRYINKCDEVELLTAIQLSIDELLRFPIQQLEAIGDYTYAPGKWTIKDILQHLIDTERIFTYRALAIARKEQAVLPSFSETDYAAQAVAGNRTLQSLIDELVTCHQSLKALYASFTNEMLLQKGKSFVGEYSVAAIGFTLAGHQRWHFEIIEEKYINRKV